MADKSKYDIMDEMGEKIALDMVGYFKTVASLSRDMESDEVNSEEFVEDMTQKLESVLLGIKVSAHFSYEMAKDLFNISQKEILSSLKNNGLDVEHFKAGYSNMLNKYSKTLLTFLIVEEEGFNIIDFGEAGGELIKGNTESLLKAIDESVVTISPENYELVVKMADENFYVGDLSNNQIQRLNDFHDDFMRRKIYPKITKVVDEKSKTLEKVIFAVKFNDLYPNET